MLKKVLSFLLFVVSIGCFAQNAPTVEKDKNGKPLPVCAKDQIPTKEKPCRFMTVSQRVGAASR